jgi:hypothetical protein
VIPRRSVVVTQSAIREAATSKVAAVVLEEDQMRVTSNGKVWRSEAEWRTICMRFAQSGLSPKEFCQREVLAVGSFRKWYQRCTGKGALSEAFVELVAPAAPPQVWAVEVELPSGVRVRFRG